MQLLQYRILPDQPYVGYTDYMKHRVLFTLVIFLAAANLMVWGLLGVQKAYADRVYPGVRVDAQPLAGLTKDQVIDRLKPIHENMTDQKVTLVLTEKEFQPTLKDLGYQVDTAAMADAALNLGRGSNVSKVLQAVLDYQKTKTIQLEYTVDQGKLNAYLNDIGKDIVKEPKDMSLDYQNGQIIVTPAENGIALDRDQLKQAIQDQVVPGQQARITLSAHQTNPVITNESQVETAKQYLTQLVSRPLVIQVEEVKETWSPETLFSFVYFDIKENQLLVAIDEEKVKAAVVKLAKKVDVKPVPKQVSAINQSIITEGSDGRQLNASDAIKRAKERLDAADMEAPLVLAVTKLDRSTTSISPEFQTGRFAGRYIEVDLSSQRMHLLEGDNYHRTFIISTGSWSNPTPIGEFKILNHIKVAWSKKYSLYMPNWMAIQPENGAYDGYGIHGLPYWPNGKREGVNHLGRPVSHGCIRLGPGDIEYVYDWAQNGTKIFIHQ